MEFIGQRPIIDSFKDSIKQKTLSHAYALTGPSGIGKKTLAQYIAKMILCTGDDVPCGYCRSCRSFETGGNPGLIVVKCDRKSLSGRFVTLLTTLASDPPLVTKCI